MGIKSIVACASVLLMSAVTSVALAGGLCSGCTIKSFGVGPYYDSICPTSSCVFVMLETQPQTQPSCSASSWHFILDTSTDPGRKSLAVLMMAYAQGKTVEMAGSGSCTLYSNAENLHYAYIVN